MRRWSRSTRDADVVCLTSANEGTSVALIEASAAGKPVIATGVGGVLDVLGAGRSAVEHLPPAPLTMCREDG